ncbi:hypothetical protein [Reticulibacter mediterranei]|uniref:hypothetical protein n=1 Tax=Reticulibacter mediterranei TaxID=2778369 RepID=UPI001C6942CC|nr:hypothetical protein [Reticulibacter mediterranei]
MSQFLRRLNQEMSDFGTSQTIYMFLFKTPSQQFSSSRQATSRLLQQVGSRARGLITGREHVVNGGEPS